MVPLFTFINTRRSARPTMAYTEGMKINWYLVAAVVFAIVAAVGWYQYIGEQDRNQEILSQLPTPPPTGILYGTFQRMTDNSIFVGILQANGEQGTLVSTEFTLSEDVSVLRRDTAANEYVSGQMSDIKSGTWVQLGTDASGAVISVTAGQ